MNTARNNRTVGLIMAMLFLVLSIPSEWIFIEHGEIEGGFPALADIPVTVTGLNGALRVASLGVPIWCVVGVGLLSCVVLLLNQREITSLPRSAVVVPWIVCTLCVSGMLLSVVFDPTIKLLIGPVIAGIGLGLEACLALPDWPKRMPVISANSR